MKNPTGRAAKKASQPARALYLYAISRLPEKVAPKILAEGIDGDAPIEAVRCGQFLCWVSRVDEDEFAHRLPDRMQDLEWLATAGLRHQRAVAEISAKVTALPTRFGTVFLTEASLADHIQERHKALEHAFERVADADEWGIKIFAVRTSPAGSSAKSSSGAAYLKHKAELLRPRAAANLDDEVKEFIAALSKNSAAASPGGKASAGQPGLVWHGSFLVRRSHRKKLEAVLKKYAAGWKGTRRIDCSGPWPPYSFVGEDVH